MSDPLIPADALEKIAQRYKLGKYAPKPSSDTSKQEGDPLKIIPTSDGFTVSEEADRLVVAPIEYRRELYRVSWSKYLLDNGQSHTQDQWRTLLHGGEWSLPDGALYYATLSALYQNRQGSHKEGIKKIQRSFRKDFRNDWMMTSTHITYAARGLDTIVHEYKQPGNYTVKARVNGPNEWVTPQSGFEESIDALLGTRNLAQLEKIFQWVSSKKPHLWRLINPPTKNEQRALVLGVNDYGRFIINANDSITNGRPARGVVAQKISGESGGRR